MNQQQVAAVQDVVTREFSKLTNEQVRDLAIGPYMETPMGNDTIDGYDIPTDPFDLLHCDGCE